MLGRMGNVKEALGLIINELKDVQEVKLFPLPVFKVCLRLSIWSFYTSHFSKADNFHAGS